MWLIQKALIGLNTNAHNSDRNKISSRTSGLGEFPTAMKSRWHLGKEGIPNGGFSGKLG